MPRTTFLSEILHLERDRFFIVNAKVFEGEVNEAQKKFLRKRNPVTGEYFTESEIFRMQHIPTVLREYALEISKHDPEIYELVNRTQLAVSESLTFDAKTYMRPDSTPSIVFSYNLLQLIHNLCTLVTLSYGVEKEDYIVAEKDMMREVANSMSTIDFSVYLKHKLLIDYKKRVFQSRAPVRLKGEAKYHSGVMVVALEMFIYGHEIAHILKNHLHSYSKVRGLESKVGDYEYKLLQRHVSKSSEFDADWFGFQFAVGYLDRTLGGGKQSLSNDIVLDAVWQFFAFMTQAGGTGSSSYPMPVDRAHVLFLTVWGNQTGVPQLNNRARQIRSLYTMGIGFYEAIFQSTDKPN